MVHSHCWKLVLFVECEMKVLQHNKHIKRERIFRCLLFFSSWFRFRARAILNFESVNSRDTTDVRKHHQIDRQKTDHGGKSEATNFHTTKAIERFLRRSRERLIS